MFFQNHPFSKFLDFSFFAFKISSFSCVSSLFFSSKTSEYQTYLNWTFKQLNKKKVIAKFYLKTL